MKALTASERPDYVEFTERQKAQDALGQPIDDWVVVFDAWVKFEVLGPRERSGEIQNEEGESVSRAKVLMLEDDRVIDTLRVVFKGSPYKILRVEPARRGGAIFLFCEKAKA